MAGKCPNCSQFITYASMSNIDLKITGKLDRKGVSYSCPNCSTVLSVEMDPQAMMAETVRKVADEVEKRIIKWSK